MARRSADEIIKALLAIPKAVRDAVDPAVEKGANEIADRARYLAPVHEGKLRASIEVRKPARPLSRRVIVHDEAGMFNEYGTVEQEQQRFFWPSVNTTKKRVRNRVDRAINRAIKKAFS